MKKKNRFEITDDYGVTIVFETKLSEKKVNEIIDSVQYLGSVEYQYIVNALISKDKSIEYIMLVFNKENNK